MSVTLHLGVKPGHEVTVTRVLLAHLPPRGHLVSNYYDSWQQWGEDPSGDEPRHIEVEIPYGSDFHLPLALHTLHSLGHLAPNDEGVMATTTAGGDHSDGVINWRLDNLTGVFMPHFH